MTKTLSIAALILLTPVSAWANQISLEGLSGTISVSTSATVVIGTSPFANAANINVSGLGGLFDITSSGDEIAIEVLTDIPVGVGTVRLHFDD